MPNLVGGSDHEPFRIYARGEKRPFGLGGDEPVVFGALRWAPIAADGTVTMTAEALRDLCNHVYRNGWRFGESAGLARMDVDLCEARDRLEAFEGELCRLTHHKRGDGCSIPGCRNYRPA